MREIKLTAAKARVFQALFAAPFTADSISGLEDVYKETLVALGNRGRLTSQFMIDLDREFIHGLYTITYRLSLYVDKETEVDMGKIIGVVFRNDELRIDVVDGTTRYSLVLKVGDGND